MLHRVIYASETVGSTGASTLSVAQILGVSERNNRRDDITSCVMFHQGFAVQAIEGARADIDRLLRRLGEDRRLREIRIISDRPIAARGLNEPMGLCGDVTAMLRAVGQPCLSALSANDAERMLELRRAA
ncbi:MAG: BLUF domain-containing protein [Alphaproteobacteria bacterium]|nr:BLUF domain-containing protein [Alphaproteobacteria bacterium]MBU2378554.1 BLUF domain-containing protein [Alphaproteobacteria bacterium]